MKHLKSNKYFMVTNEELIDLCKNSSSMRQARIKSGLTHREFRKRTKELGIYAPNQGGKGTTKSKAHDGKTSIALVEILNGNHPTYQSNKLRKRLLGEGIKEHKCECCGTTEWMGNPIPLELNHIDGNRHNHKLENLEIICPNCHALTDTYRGKNIGNYD